MGDLVTTGVRSGLAAGETHAVALSAATRGPWMLALACGLAIAVVGYLTTTARAQATADGRAGKASAARTALLVEQAESPG